MQVGEKQVLLFQERRLGIERFFNFDDKLRLGEHRLVRVDDLSSYIAVFLIRVVRAKASASLDDHPMGPVGPTDARRWEPSRLGSPAF